MLLGLLKRPARLGIGIGAAYAVFQPRGHRAQVFLLRVGMALPTVVIVMAAVSVVGFVVLGLLDGQLDIALDGDRVTRVGGTQVNLPARGTDLFGLWIAAVPVVVWGAPIGSWVAAHVRETHLVAFVALLAAVEVITTVVLVPELRDEPALVAYLLVGLAALPAALILVTSPRAHDRGPGAR